MSKTLSARAPSSRPHPRRPSLPPEPDPARPRFRAGISSPRHLIPAGSTPAWGRSPSNTSLAQHAPCRSVRRERSRPGRRAGAAAVSARAAAQLRHVYTCTRCSNVYRAGTSPVTIYAWSGAVRCRSCNGSTTEATEPGRTSSVRGMLHREMLDRNHAPSEPVPSGRDSSAWWVRAEPAVPAPSLPAPSVPDRWGCPPSVALVWNAHVRYPLHRKGKCGLAGAARVGLLGQAGNLSEPESSRTWCVWSWSRGSLVRAGIWTGGGVAHGAGPGRREGLAVAHTHDIPRSSLWGSVGGCIFPAPEVVCVRLSERTWRFFVGVSIARIPQTLRNLLFVR